LIWVYPIRVIHGVSMAFHSTTADKRGGVMGLFGISRAIAFGIGPILGSVVLDMGGHTAVFVVASVIGFAAMIMAKFGGECSKVEIETTRAALREFMRDRTLVFCTIAMFLLTIVHGGLTTFIPIHVKERMAGNLGTFYLVYSISITLVEIFAGKASDQECRIPIVLTSVALLGIGFIAVGAVGGSLTLILAAIIYGAGFGGFQVAIGAFVGDQTDDENRGAVFSIFYASYDLGIALSGVVMGAVAAGVGLGAMFYLSSIVVLPSLVLIMLSPPGGIRAAFTCGLLGDYPSPLPPPGRELVAPTVSRGGRPGVLRRSPTQSWARPEDGARGWRRKGAIPAAMAIPKKAQPTVAGISAPGGTGA
jgi:MFS family permease